MRLEQIIYKEGEKFPTEATWLLSQQKICGRKKLFTWKNVD